MMIREVIDAVANLDDFWISRVLALYDMRRQNEDIPESEVAKLLCVAASDLADCFPRNISNPEVTELFEFYGPMLLINIPNLRLLFESEGFDLNSKMEIANPHAEQDFY
jgi:hypothetical protein